MKNKSSFPFVLKLTAGLAILFLSFVIAMVLGAADTSLREVWLAITGGEKTETITMIDARIEEATVTTEDKEMVVDETRVPEPCLLNNTITNVRLRPTDVGEFDGESQDTANV